MRPVEYKPELQDESAAVMTTTFITSPIQVKPMDPNAVTKGDSPALYIV